MYEVDSYCLRYVVPFKYECAFDDAVDQVVGQTITKNKNKEEVSLWERRTTSKGGPESDLYDYIRNEFRFNENENKLSKGKVGCEWLFWKSEDAQNKDGKPIKSLRYFSDGIGKVNDDVLDISKTKTIEISNVGLMLFRNGLGFFWYELQEKKNKSCFNSDELRVFQNKIRELNQSQPAVLWEETDKKPSQGILIKDISNHQKYLTPFQFGAWVNENIGFLNVQYIAERECSYENFVSNSMNGLKDKTTKVKISKQKENGKGVEHIEEDISNLIIKENTNDHISDKAPDKAILFSYVSFLNEREDDSLDKRYELAYHIANGYTESYMFSDDLQSEIKNPFSNVLWYATQEGVSYLAWPEPKKNNKEVFNSTIKSKIKTDYFTLFMKVLFQSFSLMIYAEKIQSEISSIYDENIIEKKVTTLFGQINLFLTKSMATSVSHIHHQSEFYVYLKRQFRIHDDVKSVTSGLNTLDVLQREQYQREEEKREKKSDSKIQAIMGLFALLGISSALFDAYGFVRLFEKDIYDLQGGVLVAEAIVLPVIAIIGLVALIVEIIAIRNAFKDR